MLTNVLRDHWNKTHPFEFTHAYLIVGEKYLDVRGNRSARDMAVELECEHAYAEEASWPPAYFRRRYMGKTHRYALYGSKELVADARKLIHRHAAFYSEAVGLPIAA